MLFQRKYTQRAFTLIEIMFVIIVIALIAYTGTRFLGNEADEVKANIAAKEIRQWLQAGERFQSQFNAWPDSASELQSAYGDTLKMKNPWGNPFEVKSVGPTKGSFAVSTTTQTASQAVRVKSFLGFGSVSDRKVTAFIGSAISEKVNEGIIIKQIKNVSLTGDWHKRSGEESGGDADKQKHLSSIDQSKLRDNARRILIPVPQCPADMQAAHNITLSGFAKGCHQVKEDEDNWECAGAVAGNIYSSTTFTREVKPYQTQVNPIQTNQGLMWEYWVKTSGKSVNGFLGLGKQANHRDLPNYHGGLMYITYCKAKQA